MLTIIGTGKGYSLVTFDFLILTCQSPQTLDEMNL